MEARRLSDEELNRKLEDIEDLLAMKEALSAVEEKVVSLEEYERRRAS